MAKKKPIRVTDAIAAEAEPHFAKFVAAKLRKVGAPGGARRFSDDRPLRSRLAKRFYQRYLNDGGKAGDWQSFAEWLLAHWDEILNAIAKLLPLFIA